MLKLSFSQTRQEVMVRAAATIVFQLLKRGGCLDVPVSDLAEKPQYGFTASAIDEPIGPKLVRITDLQDAKIKWDTVPYCECPEPRNYALATNDILFARTGATTGKTHLVIEPQDAVFASYLIRLRPKAGVAAAYLYAFFQSDAYWCQITEEKRGSAQPNVNGEKLAALVIPNVDIQLQHAIGHFIQIVRARQDGSSKPLQTLPAPLQAATGLVTKVEELAAKIEEAQILRTALSPEVDALLLASRNRLIGERPTDGWVSLHTLIDDIENGWSPQCESCPATGDEWGVLKVGAVSFGTFDSRENKALPALLEPKPDYEIKSGDFLMSRANTTELVGACALVKESPPRLMLCDKIFRFIFKPDSPVLPSFLDHVLKSPALREQIELGATGTSPTMKNISKAKILSLQLPVMDTGQQRRIVAYLDELQAKVDCVKALQAQTQAELDALLPSILDKAFKGEL